MFGTKRKSKGKKAPISAHPGFPAVVALWFAALLGLGSLVLPVTLFEKAVTLTGLSSLVSAAQPPLGTTARIAIAVVAGVVGAVAGLLIARKVVAAQKTTEAGRNVFAKANLSDQPGTIKKKPISAHEELGAGSFDEPIADEPNGKRTYGGKRRALAVTDDSGPSEYLEAAPLPGGAAMIDQTLFGDEAHSFSPQVGHDDALELADLADGEIASGELDTMPSFDPTAAPQADYAAAFSQPVEAPEILLNNTEHSSFGHDPVAELREELGTMTDHSNAAEPAAYNPFAQHSAPVESAPSPFARPVETRESQPQGNFGKFAAPPAAMAPVENRNIPSGYSPVDTYQEEATGMASVTPHNSGPHDSGMAELVERFARALKAKADAAADMQAAESAGAPLVFQRSAASAAAAPFAPSGADEAGHAVAEFFSAPSAAPRSTAVPPASAPTFRAAEPARFQEAQAYAPASTAPRMPTAMLPVGFDDADDDMDEVPALSLSMSASHHPFTPFSRSDFGGAPSGVAPTAQPGPFTVVAAEDEEEAEEENSAYSSLLAMKSPFASGQEFVRIDDDDQPADGSVQPAVVFPGAERKAAPASDGPTRDPIFGGGPDIQPAPRRFDAPGQSPINRAAGQAPKASPGETERALKEALEKLQRMSGAA